MKEEEIPPSGGTVIQFPDRMRKPANRNVVVVKNEPPPRPRKMLVGEGLPDKVKQDLQQPVEIQPAGDPIKRIKSLQVLRKKLNENRKDIYIGMVLSLTFWLFFLGPRRILDYFRILFNFVLDFILFILSFIF